MQCTPTSARPTLQGMGAAPPRRSQQNRRPPADFLGFKFRGDLTRLTGLKNPQTNDQNRTRSCRSRGSADCLKAAGGMDLIRNFLGGGSNGEEPDAKRVKREDDGSAGAARARAQAAPREEGCGGGGVGAERDGVCGARHRSAAANEQQKQQISKIKSSSCSCGEQRLRRRRGATARSRGRGARASSRVQYP